jgi:hypothetical protein
MIYSVADYGEQEKGMGHKKHKKGSVMQAHVCRAPIGALKASEAGGLWH